MHAIDRKLSAPAQGASQQIFGHYGFYIIHYLAGLLGGRPVGPPAPAGGLTKNQFLFLSSDDPHHDEESNQMPIATCKGGGHHSYQSCTS